MKNALNNVNTVSNSQADPFGYNFNTKYRLSLKGSTQNTALNSMPNGADVYQKLERYYQETEKKQGIIGKSWNAVKNFLNIGTTDKKAEQALLEYSTNLGNTEKQTTAIEIVNKYGSSQHIALNTTRNIASSVAATGAIALLGAILKGKNIKIEKDTLALLKVGLGALAGVIVAPAVKKLDAMSAKREYDKKEMTNDIIQGGVQGTLSGIASFITSLFEGVKGIGKMAMKFVAKNTIRLFAIFGLPIFENAALFKSTPFLLKIMSPKLEEQQANTQKLIEESKEKEKYKEYDPINMA